MHNGVTLIILAITLTAMIALDILFLEIGEDVRTLLVGLAGAAIFKLKLNKEPIT